MDGMNDLANSEAGEVEYADIWHEHGKKCGGMLH
jgi:hypothetical protein